ncbi:hypothetical protein [Luedemannella helvata]|uniref:Uncharacterized protein n=1 Tax=Luedemannella helvata TaxID=349315 RepID=A0ABN2KGX6_9ACTN
MLPRSGDVLRVTSAASIQFNKPMMFRVIRVQDWQTYNGWAWLDGYQLNSAGDAVERRCIFVQIGGLQPAAVGMRNSPVRSSAAQNRQARLPDRHSGLRSNYPR